MCGVREIFINPFISKSFAYRFDNDFTRMIIFILILLEVKGLNCRQSEFRILVMLL